MIRLVIHPEAEADLAEARAWYDGRHPGLGEEFLRRVGDAFEDVRRCPEMRARVLRELRLAPVVRFPYVVVYRVDDDQVTVVAVYHTRRDPRGWRGRGWRDGEAPQAPSPASGSISAARAARRSRES